jgi:hypothetical protein
MTQGWMEIPVCGWDMSLCAVSRMNIATGMRWQRHQIINIGAACGDGTQFPYVYHGAQTTLNPGMSAAMTPQQQLGNPGTPGYGISNWDWRNSWMWAVKQVGYQVAWWGKVTNSWPCLLGDGYVLNVSGNNILDRYCLFLDDSALDNQTDTTMNAYQTGQPYSGVDHRLHNESNYFATAAAPFIFNNNLNNGGGTTLLTNTGAPGDSWNTSAYLGTAGQATRQAGNASAFLPDYYNRLTYRFLSATSAVPDNGGQYPKPPFIMYVAPRGSHAAWVVGQRHWNVVPQNSPGRNLGTTDHALASGATSLQWTTEPSLTNLSTANGAYVFLGCELCQVTAGIGTGTWTLARDVLQDAEVAMPQVTGSPAWPVGTSVIQVSSSTSPDTGDKSSFNEPDLSDKSPWWRGCYPPMTPIQCVGARHDRIIKAKCGMASDELFYDIMNYCQGHFSNPTVAIILSDNGWTYGEHANPKGKWKPYDLPGVGPLWCYWPDPSSAGQYPYFSQRPNIIVFLADDDDTESLVSGYPILAAATSGCRQESNCVAWNGDLAATICDLAGATPYSAMDGISLAPYMSGAATGKTPRLAGWLNCQSDVTGGQPSFYGLYSINKRYWKWGNYTVPSYALQSGITKANAPAGTYTGITEAYDHTVDPDEVNNFIANPAVNPGYTPPNTFTPAVQADLESMYQAAQRLPRPSWVTDPLP